ncbi:hypothetical protein D3C87_1866080 [compost metagenome]
MNKMPCGGGSSAKTKNSNSKSVNNFTFICNFSGNCFGSFYTAFRYFTFNTGFACSLYYTFYNTITFFIFCPNTFNIPTNLIYSAGI